MLERYQLNAHREGVLFELRKPFRPLPKEDAIDWSYFFDFGNGNLAYAKRFEPRIVDTFLNMPGPIDNPLEWPFAVPNKRDLRSIAVRNLLRARAFELPSGQTVAARMDLTPLTQKQLGLADSGLAEAPLWYYVLAEAEHQTRGATLGDVGSRIVGEVFTGLVKGDSTSYLSVAPGWKPTLGKRGKFTMTDLLEFAGAYPPPE